MRLSDIDAMEYCLYQLPTLDVLSGNDIQLDEASGLLSNTVQPGLADNVPKNFDHRPDWSGSEAQNTISLCAGLTALEIAVVAEAKHFLSRTKVQEITNGIWLGRITFEETGFVHAPRVPRLYNKAKDSIATRLKVPIYIKSFELLFYLGFFILCCFISYQEHESGVRNFQTFWKVDLTDHPFRFRQRFVELISDMCKF